MTKVFLVKNWFGRVWAKFEKWIYSSQKQKGNGQKISCTVYLFKY